jgi:hypothetical protein
MFMHSIKKPALFGLGLCATLAAALAGCSGSPTENSDVNVVLPEPSTTVSSKGAAAPSASAPAAGAEAAPAPGAAASATPTKAEGWGTLKGQIVFGGTPPEAKVLQEKGKAVKDPDMCAVDAPIMSERLVVDSGTKGVKNVLVYLPKPTAVNDDAKKSATAKTVTFDQKRCMFEPHVLGLMTGVPVTLKSSDPKPHNVNIKLKQSPGNTTIGADKPYVFTPLGAERSPGNIICDIHPWMSAWWMVLDNPYLAVTDEKGNFEIKYVPAGTQKVVVWQESVKGQGFVTAPVGEDVTIKPNDVTVKDFTIAADKLLPAG